MEYNAIKAARVGFGYSQDDMARALGVTKKTYWNKENGKSKFTDPEKTKLAEIFNWNLFQVNKFLYGGALPVKQ